MAELVIQREMMISQVASGLTNTSTMSLSNVGNCESYPIFTLNINNALSTLTVSNLTTGVTTIISDPSNLISGATLRLYPDAAYSSASTELITTFNGVFSLEEDVANSLKFTLSPSTATTIDVTAEWLQPSPVEKVVSYCEGFQLSESRTQRKSGVNLLNKYNKSYINQEIAYSFTMDKLYCENWFEEEAEDETYRIKIATDSEVDGIEQITYYLCGCSLNSISHSYQDGELIKENIGGVACRKFQG